MGITVVVVAAMFTTAIGVIVAFSYSGIDQSLLGNRHSGHRGEILDSTRGYCLIYAFQAA